MSILELFREFDAANRRRRIAINLIRQQAWWSVALRYGTKHLPALSSILLPIGSEAPPAPPTQEQTRGLVEIMHALYGGRIIRGDWTKQQSKKRKRKRAKDGR